MLSEEQKTREKNQRSNKIITSWEHQVKAIIVTEM